MSHRLFLVPLLAAVVIAGGASAAEAEHEHDHGDEAKGEHADEGGGDEVKLPAEVVAAFGIISEPAKPRTLAALILAPGWIAYDPAGQAHIATPAAGRVTKVHGQEGDAVKAGDALVEILSPTYVEAQSSYILKRAASVAAAIREQSTKETLERGEKAGEGISGAELKRRQAETRQAEVAKVLADAELTAALSAVRLLSPGDADLEALTKDGKVATTLVLRAPVAGTIVERTAIPGQQVASDAPPLLILADTSRLWVVANVPEAQMTKVSVGSRAEIHTFDGDRIGTGDIASVTPGIDTHTRSGRARLAIRGSAAIRPGMYVQVRITPLEAETGQKVIAVPEAAVLTVEGRSVVFVSEGAGSEVHFRARPVMTGPTMAGFIPILKGLEEGTPVVVRGAFMLKADLGKAGAEHEH